jgi:ubiquinone/menaquinone biosynthesis C-methylase UbiE
VNTQTIIHDFHCIQPVSTGMPDRLNEGRRPLSSRLLQRLLACPRCHSTVTVGPEHYECSSCGFRAPLTGDLVHALQEKTDSFFDAHFKTMESGNQDEGIIRLCYERQAEIVRNLAKPGSTILDVGCGPALAYERSAEWTVVGLDPSLESLRSNDQLDLRLFGSAEHIPLRNSSIELIVCFYSVHHMVGQKRAENRTKVNAAFGEFARIIRPGGNILIFDMSPWLPVWLAECLLWNVAKSQLGSKLDMFFWHRSALARLGEKLFPVAKLEFLEFPTPLSTTFPPIFALPKFRLPRALYPLDPIGYRWRF